MQVQFYHLTSTPLERALPKLVEKAYAADYRIHIGLGSEALVNHLDELLWTYDPGSFLPHATAANENAERQPILLATGCETRPNSPTLLMVTDGTQLQTDETIERVLDIFDGNNDEATAQARKRWKHYADNGIEVSYFRQKENGAWEKKQ